MKPPLLHCILCGRITPQRCAYCQQPVCHYCHLKHRGKSYCSPQHRNNDSGITRFIHRWQHLMPRQY